MHNREIEYLTLRKYKGFEELGKFMSRTKVPQYESPNHVNPNIYNNYATIFPLLHTLQTCPGAHRASYPTGTEVDIPEGKAAEA
jgi:hypothetical protein